MKKSLLFALILMGFTSLIVQTLLIREFLISFYGNELTIGVILFNWIILEAIGSNIFSRFSERLKRPYLSYALLQAGISIYLPIGIFLIRNIKNLLGFNLGEGLGIGPIFLSSFFIIFALSIFDGAQFPIGCRLYKENTLYPEESAGRVYILEAVGFILAGPLFTYLLITHFNSLFIALIISAFNLFCGLLLLKQNFKEKMHKIFFFCISLLFLTNIILFFGPVNLIENLSIQKQWQKIKVLKYKNSLYANLVTTQAQNQYTFYSDGIPIITTPIPDINYVEDLVHFSLLSHQHPKKVLILGSALGGPLKEILKYPIQEVHYVELDPELIKMAKEFPTQLTQKELSDKRVKIHYLDGVRFVYFTEEKFDVIILNLPMPSNLQLNRFYTEEFFKKIKSILNEEGIFTLSLAGSLSYLNLSLKNLNGSILNTLENVFKVSVIPGDYNLYLCAKKELKLTSENLLEKINQTNIETKLFNNQYLQYRLNPFWKDWFLGQIKGYKSLRKNQNLSPISMFYSLWQWNSLFSPKTEIIFKLLDKFNFRFFWLATFLISLILLFLKRAFKQAKKIGLWLAIATTGFMGMGLELIILYMYQVFFGYIFSHIGLLTTFFMAGLTLGALNQTKNLEKKDKFSFLKIELFILGLVILCLILFLLLNQYNFLRIPVIFFLLTFLTGILVGEEFPLANKLYYSSQITKTAGILYSLDLLGACFSCLFISLIMVPLAGITQSLLFILSLKILSFLFILFA